MDPNYSLTQQKIYSDYSSKTSEQLLDILKLESKYSNGVIDIVSDILNDRNALPDDKKENYGKERENEDVNIVDKLLAESNKEEALHNMIYGAIIGGFGIIITLGTYLSTLNGGVYVIAWGAILTGTYKFIKGVFNYVD